MRRRAALLGLVLVAAPAAALAQAAEESLTPRSPPTAVLRKATPIHAEPKGRAPAGLTALLPLPVPPVPLSPVLVPGELPSTAAEMPVAVAPPTLPAAPPPVPESMGPLPGAKPKPPVADVPAPEKPSTPKKGTGRTVYAKDDVYVRASPGRDGKVLDALEPGAAVELVPGEAEGSWARVSRNGKVLGWVASSFLLDRPPSGRSTDGCALPPDFPSKRGAPIAEGTSARVLADANVRKSPACNAPVLDVLEEGETVTVTGSTGTWYRVERRGRSLGYVSIPLLGEAKGR